MVKINHGGTEAGGNEKAAGLKLRPWEKGKGQVLTADAVADHDEEEGAKTEQERVARRFGDCGDRHF